MFEKQKQMIADLIELSKKIDEDHFNNEDDNRKFEEMLTECNKSWIVKTLLSNDERININLIGERLDIFRIARKNLKIIMEEELEESRIYNNSVREVWGNQLWE